MFCVFFFAIFVRSNKLLAGGKRLFVLDASNELKNLVIDPRLVIVAIINKMVVLIGNIKKSYSGC